MRTQRFNIILFLGEMSCEADTNVVNTPYFDLSRLGIDCVASPRHADGILVTGPISRNMRTALLAFFP